jgi:hypothetical protein
MATLWRYDADTSMVASVTRRAGGLALTGNTKGNFLAFDDKDGRVLLTKKFGDAIAGGIVTYQLGAVQWVAVAGGMKNTVTQQTDSGPTWVAPFRSQGPDTTRRSLRRTAMRMRTRLATVILGTTVLVPGTSTAAPQPPPQLVASPTDPAVDAYTTFVQGKQPEAPVDRAFVVAALDRLVSAVEALALTQTAQSATILSTAHKVRREIRRLAPTSGDTPSQIKGRINVFVAVAHLVDDVARALAPPGAPRGAAAALLRAADGLDFDYPLRWQPNNIQLYFDLASRALTQIVSDVR